MTPMPTLHAFFVMDPLSPYATGEKTFPEWVGDSTKSGEIVTVRVEVEKADPKILAEITGYPSAYMEHSLEIVKQKAQKGATVHKVGPSSFVVSGGAGGIGVSAGGGFTVKMSKPKPETKPGYPLHSYLLKSHNKITSTTNLPSWLTSTQDPLAVLVDVIEADPEELASLTGWSVSVISSFLAVAKKEVYVKMAEDALTALKPKPPVMKPKPPVIEGEMMGLTPGPAYIDELGWATGKIAEMTFTEGDVVEFKANQHEAVEKFIKNKHGLAVPHTVTIPITATTDTNAEALKALFQNAPKDEDAWTTGPDPVESPPEAPGSPVTLSDKAKASLSPDRQRIAQKALEAVTCKCYWKVSPGCPVHGTREDVTIAVVNAVLDYLGVIP